MDGDLAPALKPVMRLAPDNVALLWDQVATLIRPALAQVSTHTANDVRRAVLAMRAQLWVQMDGPHVAAAVVTEFVDYPSGLFVRVWLAGAGSKMDDDAFYEALDQWRDVNGAVGFEAIGRQGWMRRFPEARVEGLVMRMTVR